MTGRGGNYSSGWKCQFKHDPCCDRVDLEPQTGLILEIEGFCMTPPETGPFNNLLTLTDRASNCQPHRDPTLTYKPDLVNISTNHSSILSTDTGMKVEQEEEGQKSKSDCRHFLSYFLEQGRRREKRFPYFQNYPSSLGILRILPGYYLAREICIIHIR